QWFVPVGVSKWSGDVAALSALKGELSVLSFESGFGYAFRPSSSIKVPVGLRAGMYQLELSANIAGAGYSYKTDGLTLAPFAGFSKQLSSSFSLGYEARMPLFVTSSNKPASDGDSTNDDKKTGNSVPTYQMLMVSLRI